MLVAIMSDFETNAMEKTYLFVLLLLGFFLLWDIYHMYIGFNHKYSTLKGVKIWYGLMFKSVL